MSESQWERDNAPTMLTEDDTSGENIFGENALRIGDDDTGVVVTKAANIETGNMELQSERYWDDDAANFNIFHGVRGDQAAGANCGDG